MNNLKLILITLIVILSSVLLIWFIFWRGSGVPEFSSDIGQEFSANINFPLTYNQPLILTLADFAISIMPLNALPAQAAEQGNVVKYINAFANTDVVQTRYAYKIKEDIILKQPGHPEIFEYQIDLTWYDFKKDEQGNMIFYEKGHKGDSIYIRFAIPAPFMVDANGQQSSTEDVAVDLKNNGKLTIKPSVKWLAQAKYPVVLDQTIEISIINVHSHPQQGENWTVDFITRGKADLKIIPNDQATIDDDEFVSLKCGSEARQPQILAGDVIYYPNWSCAEKGQVIHYTKKAGNHTLRFEFGGQVVYAYNSSTDASIVFRAGVIFRTNYAAAESDATGGTISYSGGYTIHKFTSSETFTVNTAGTVEYLVVAGGGGGGFYDGGGGGAGGFRTGSGYAVTPQAYSITVGGGGDGATSGAAAGSNGQDSVFGTITSLGGGGGGSYTPAVSGLTGGSGGGGSTQTPAGGGAAGTGGQGYDGGDGNWANGYPGGGGGGASAAGQDASTTNGGNGGNGTASSISGASVTYAGGGGGGQYTGSPGSGGSGGGGNGGTTDVGSNGTANTGGGGGGGGFSVSGKNGGNGGSGIVIIRYLTHGAGTPGTATIFRAPDIGPKYIGSTYVNTAGYTVAGTPVPITLPTNTKVGDLVLIFNAFSGLTSSASTINKTGWTSNIYLGDTVNSYYHTIFTKVVASDDLSGITITPSAASTGNTYGGFEAITFRNCSSFNVQLNATGNTTDTSISIPGITKNDNSAFVLTLISDRTGSASWTPAGANWTELTEGKDQTGSIFDNTGSYVSSGNYTSGTAITWTRTVAQYGYSNFTVDVIR